MKLCLAIAWLACFAAAAEWRSLAPLPDVEGFASPFAGVSSGALIVAGGANMPKDKWAETPVKVWHNKVFVLESPTNKQWQTGFSLPRALGYGVSVTADDSVLCFGGSDAQRHYAEGFRLQWRDGTLKQSGLPRLPAPCANACGALVDRVLYIAGGLETPTSTTAMHSFWALNLDELDKGWQQLTPWPGPARMLAVAGSHAGSFYLFSGAELSAGPDGKPVRRYLRDAFRYTPAKGWETLPKLPRAAVAAPSPASESGGKLHLFSGDDGANVNFTPVKNHPGFPRSTLSFDATTNQWSELPGLPFSRATAPVVQWQGSVVVPNGELRPRVRTPEVWQQH